MWMIGCSDGTGFNMSDSFNDGKLRPLMPRHGSNSADLFALNTHLATTSEQSKREFSDEQPVVSSRWNPTPEQLRTLEELYRRGTRTPTAEQIQHITAHLRRFGKIEGKNVFYWFQNHKARERQKRRRRDEEQRCCHAQSLQKKESGSSRTGFEGEQTRNCAPHTNCSALAEEYVSMQSVDVSIQSVVVAEGEFQLRRSSVERNAMWQMTQLSCSPPTLLTNTIAIAKTEATTTTTDPKPINNQNLDTFITSNKENEECEESRTLQLFPLRSDDDNGVQDTNKESALQIPTINTDSTPYQFFLFLPLNK